MKTRSVFLSAILILILAACAPVERPANEDVMMDKSTATIETMVDEQPTDAMMEEKPMVEATEDSMHTDDMTSEKKSMPDEDSAMMDSPAWFDTKFINVTSGETFKISDFKGKVVLVETMATWCSNCLKQQKQVKTLHELLGEMNTDLISVGVGIDINEDADMLKNYVQKQGFDWYYSIATAEVANEIGNLYGTQFLNPPSTPILLIDRSGTVHVLPFGIKDAASLKEAVLPLLEEKM